MSESDSFTGLLTEDVMFMPGCAPKMLIDIYYSFIPCTHCRVEIVQFGQVGRR